MKVVYIGADSEVAGLVRLSMSLRWPDTALVVANTCQEGLKALDQAEPDVVFLQADLPDVPLTNAIGAIRGFSNVPMLVLSQLKSETELVTALESGADDYVRLPFELTELMARVWALLRRETANSYDGGVSIIRSGDLLLNPATYEAFLGKQQVMLSSTEFRMLYLLAQNLGSVMSHESLEGTLWGEGVNSSGLVKKYVQRVRQKLGDSAQTSTWITSVHGVGYRFTGPKAEFPQPTNRTFPVLVRRQTKVHLFSPVINSPDRHNHGTGWNVFATAPNHQISLSSHIV